MPSSSKQQQKFMGLVLAYKQGKVPASKVSKNVKQVANSMSVKELEKYAGTSHKGLPKKAESFDVSKLNRNAITELKSIISNTVDRVLKEGVKEKQEDPLLTPEQKREFIEQVSRFNEYGQAIYRQNNLKEAYKNIKSVVEFASKHITEESGDWFDQVTLGRHSKKLKESMKIFEKTVAESIKLQQRLESVYEEIGETLNRYYKINGK
jgi:hypothetical protein